MNANRITSKQTASRSTRFGEEKSAAKKFTLNYLLYLNPNLIAYRNAFSLCCNLKYMKQTTIIEQQELHFLKIFDEENSYAYYHHYLHIHKNHAK